MRRGRFGNSEARAGWIFMAPAVGVFLVFLILPLLFTLFISSSNWNGITPVAQQSRAAVGVVEFTNLTSEGIEIATGQLIGSTNPNLKQVKFETTENAILTGNSRVVVPVQATEDSAGKVGNFGPNQLDLVIGPLSDKLRVTNLEPTTGGQNSAFDLVGSSNYESLFFNEGINRTSFSRAMINTVYYVIGVVPIQTFLAMILAIIVNQHWLRARSFFRTAFYLPSVTSSVVISLIFMFMFSRGGIVNGFISWLNPQYEKVDWLNDSRGLVHMFLANFGINRENFPLAEANLGGLTLWDWISGPSITMSMIMGLNIWTTTGTLLVIFLAALQSIPASVYEAAAIDGAKWWSTLKNITIPLIRPTTFLVVTIGLISTFQVFDQVFVITEGGPANTTVTVGYLVYQNAFQRGQMGLAAATAIVLFLVIFVFSLIQRRIQSDRGNG